ncbi:MAG: GMP synthase (glutamine-hydrolysing) [Bacillota bacterium]|nr:MAG: GMP synthase (glutamine-hydrolysing) [Bacillota bacterium]MBS3951220.1 glutamine-hydrolyzing GMP synthase [Peptococcaceae bacterium]
MQKQREMVIIIDFGGQYAQLIARRTRELNVYSEIWAHTKTAEEIKQANPVAVIFSGGPNSVYAENAPRVDMNIFKLGVPVLGICYGMQLMAQALGGSVAHASDKREYGRADLLVTEQTGIFAGLPSKFPVWMSHGDSVALLPDGFVNAAHTVNTPLAAMYSEELGMVGVQFHPEVVHGAHGTEMLRKFLFAVAEAKGDWIMTSFMEEATETIKNKVSDAEVICGLSGGVDSSVAAVLLHRAIGEQLTSIFVDHGMLRKGEAEQVVRTFRDELGLKLVYVDASVRFLAKLEGITEPEQKRKIIGNEFIRVFEEEANKIGEAKFLVQGTLYPDVIESGTSTAATIKTHHNVGGLPKDMKFALLEPFRYLFKDEVRVIGRELGLPDVIVDRHPFPGPGLAVRIMGEITRAKLELLREADHIVREEIEFAGLYKEIWQCFAVLPGVRSVGVMGDERTYAEVIGVRAVSSTDAMTADWYRMPYDVLERISSRIVNEVKGVNRVVYDITSKPPGTIEWE